MFDCQSQFIPLEAARFFKHFYAGLAPDHLIWHPFLGSQDKYELPTKFNFEKVASEADSMTILKESITPRILLVDFYSG